MTSTNALVDVVQFFSEHVFQDLQAAADAVHPILQVDAIRFLYSFRNQVRPGCSAIGTCADHGSSSRKSSSCLYCRSSCDI